MLQYLINTTAIWLISLVLFDAFLRRESYHSYNRFYLLFTFLLGALLPLWKWLAAGNNYSTSSDHALYTAGTRWAIWLILIYLSGVLVAFSILVIDVIKLVLLYRYGNKSAQHGWTVIETGKEHSPFSCLDVFFVTRKDQYTADEWDMIVAHEMQHSRLLHLIDLFIMQFTHIILWFHPMVYIYSKRLNLVHEYQADSAASQRPGEYGRFLIEQAVLQAAPTIAHSFNRSPIKNRIAMLTKNASPRTGKSNLKLLIIFPLTIFCLVFFTKNSYSENKVKPGSVWKKQVARIIDISEKEEPLDHHLRDVSPDTTILEMMVNAINAGKVTAYAGYDNNFTVKLTKETLNEMLVSKPDTITLTDPVSGKEITKVTRKDFDFNAIHKYRILEQWTFNQSSGKTEIEIIGIAPIQDIYGYDGSFRGVRGLFFLHFNDAWNIINRYELYHPNNTISSLIWNDYFNPGTTNTVHP